MKERLKRYFIEYPKNLYLHLKEHWWLYVTIVILLVAYKFYAMIVDLLGVKNTHYLLAFIAVFTLVLWWKKHRPIRTFWRYLHTRKNLYKLKIKQHFEAKNYIRLISYISFYLSNIFVRWSPWLIPVLAYLFYPIELQEYILWSIENVTFFLLVVVFILISYLKFRHDSETLKIRLSKSVVWLGLLAALFSYQYFDVQKTAAQYFYYQDLKANIDDKQKEVFTPQVRALSLGLHSAFYKQQIKGNNIYSKPDITLDENGNMVFTASIVDFKKRSRYFEGQINGIIETDATKTNLKEYYEVIDVDFTVDENLVLSRNAISYATKSLGWRYFFSKATNVQYLRNTKTKKHIAVVSIQSLTGNIFYPRPEFSGVVIIKQGDINYVNRAIIGDAEFIHKNEITDKAPYLLKQNLNSITSTHYIAESYAKFVNGFDSFVFHDNDLQITEMKSLKNKLPIITLFKVADLDSKLYDFYELKYYLNDSNNADRYMLIPSDGLGKIYVMNDLDGVGALDSFYSKIEPYFETIQKGKFSFDEPRPYFKEGLPKLYLLSGVFVKDNGDFEYSNVKSILLNPAGQSNIVLELPTDKPEVWEQMARDFFLK